ncbi:hypothetical protein [Hymenobacter yonginensis]|uniref:Uncharacterized protein n=1 Tax=Hymenobacter yonginensis TaxID=748197 RepID=A0ABY7PUW7_9BACT|nr:hypothetical protein [Hymenobacter yonginensis]WBO86701.1 hypothetical protein O9Z63_20690 [Hymenobacter yonginensis]
MPSPATPLAVYGDTLRLGAFTAGDTLYFSYPMYYAHAAAVHYGVRVVARGDSVHAAQLVYPTAETAVWEGSAGAAAFYRRYRPQARVLAQSHRPRVRQLAQLDNVLRRIYHHTAVGTHFPADLYALEWGARWSVVDDRSNGLHAHRAVQQVLGLPLQPIWLDRKPRMD